MRIVDTSRDLALKAATRQLVRACGGVEAAAAVCRVSKAPLSQYGGKDHPETFMPVDVVADLEADCGDPIVSRLLSRLSADGMCGGAPEPVKDAVKLAAEVGALCKAAIDAEVDGRVDAGEHKALDEMLTKIELAARDARDRLFHADAKNVTALRG